MNQLFKKLGLAITFSPTGRALLKEALRLKNVFSSELVLIHVGHKTPETEKRLNESIKNAGLQPGEAEIVWGQGDPSNVILKKSQAEGVDLLIAGALEKETLVKYYIGSVARKIMRQASSSVLILTKPSEETSAFKKFYVSTDYSTQSEKTVLISYEFARLEHAEEFVVVRDFHIPGVVSTVLDSGSYDKLQETRSQWLKEEEEKLRLFVEQMHLKGIEVKTHCIYGKEGWEASNYARANHADLFAITAPSRKLKFLDRLFPHEAEYSFEVLPSNLLIVR